MKLVIIHIAISHVTLIAPQLQSHRDIIVYIYCDVFPCKHKLQINILETSNIHRCELGNSELNSFQFLHSLYAILPI